MSINVRELKTHLSEYLRRAERGETVTVTSHGRVVAQIVPPFEQTRSAVETLRDQPWIEPGKLDLPALGLSAPIEWPDDGPSFSDLLADDRE